MKSQMRSFVILIILVLVLCLPKVVLSETTFIGTDVINTVNSVMDSIYSEIDSDKGKYDEFKLFSLYAKPKNKLATSLDYSYVNSKVPKSRKDFEIGIEVLPISQHWNKSRKYSIFEERFPLLGIKIVGFQNQRYRTDFNLEDYFYEQLQPIIDKQNEELPVLLTVKPDKPEFRVNEEVTFTVTLKNVSKTMMRIHKLGDESLVFLYDGEDIEAKPGRAELQTIKPNEEIIRKFTGGAYENSKEFFIKATYLMSFKSVNPSALTKIKIVR